MTEIETTRTKEIIDEVMDLLMKLKYGLQAENEPLQEDEKTEMLTVKECCKEIKYISEYTVRLLALEGKIKSVRVGKSGRGKILINKKSLIDYFANAQQIKEGNPKI